MKTQAALVVALAALSMITARQARAEASSPMNDSQIAAMVKTVDDAEIKAAKVAKSRAQTKEVKDFADHMIDEHKANEKQEKTLASKLGIKAETTVASDDVKAGAKDQMSDMKKAKGLDFDKAYIANQIAAHQKVLSDIDNKLLPNAQSADMKSFLQETRTHVSQHLAMAQQIQATLTK